jgi:hypothetical protein
VWQQIHERLADRPAAIVSVAVDAQGIDRVRPYVEHARAGFPTLLDEASVLARLLGFKAVPNGVLVDDAGIVRYAKFGGFTVQDVETRVVVERWLGEGRLEPAAPDGAVVLDAAALSLFEEGLAALRRGDPEAGARLWRQAAARDPGNWLIRKQLWALEHPDRFYAGPVDFDWQKEQIARGL